MQKYSKVQFQSPIFAAGVNIGTFLPAANKTFHKLDMSWSLEGMVVAIEDANYRISNCTILVPWANICWTQLLPKARKDADANPSSS